MRKPISQELASSIRAAGIGVSARAAGLHPQTLMRALVSGTATERTLAALERIKDRLRTADEFKSKGGEAVRAPRTGQAIYSWTLESIRKARDNQQIGVFAQPVALATAMRTNAHLFTAYHNRIAAHMSLATELVAVGGARGKGVRKRAGASVIVPRDVLQGIVGTLANHGLAVGHILHEPNRDGTRVDMRLEEWPLEHVRWNAHRRVLETAVEGGGTADIVHGDGEWIVFRKFAREPWKQEACVLPGALLWAADAGCLRDWAAASTSHGQAKIVGELPEGWALRTAEGALTAEAAAFVALLRDLVSGEIGAGVKPHGAAVDFISNGSTAWQVFKELATLCKQGAAYIYLGTDAIPGSQGGAPGVDVSALFGVATTKIQGDVQAIEDGLNTGLYAVWTAVNEGDSRYAPKFRYVMPDPDASQAVEQIAARRAKFFEALDLYKKNGMLVDQGVIAELARQYRITPPVLAPIASASVPLVLAPTDVAKVVRVREARSAQGLPPLGDERDDKMLPELDAPPATAPAPAAP